MRRVQLLLSASDNYHINYLEQDKYVFPELFCIRHNSLKLGGIRKKNTAASSAGRWGAAIYVYTVAREQPPRAQTDAPKYEEKTPRDLYTVADIESSQFNAYCAVSFHSRVITTTYTHTYCRFNLW